MKTFLALLVGWFLGIFTLAFAAGRVLADVMEQRQIINVPA